MSEAKITEDFYGVLTPAYGRDYRSVKEFEKDFREDKDFKLHLGVEECYCSVRDFKPGVKVQIRFQRNTKTTVIKV